MEYAIKQYEHDKVTGALPPAQPATSTVNTDTPTAAGLKPAAVDPLLEPESEPEATPEPKGPEITLPDAKQGGFSQESVDLSTAPEKFIQESFLDTKLASPPEKPSEPAASAANFHITDDDLGTGGPKAKYAMNVAAIRTLKAVEGEGRSATQEEQEILSRYVGWGGVPDAFEPGKPYWAGEYAELRSLLTEEEYQSARASVLNAHFTSPVVIRAIYEALGNMGFVSGNILEPSCGVGNFFGLLPEGMAASRLYGVELDSISGRIAQQLYPKARITVAGFETTDRRDFFDVAVGNVPFGDYGVSDPAYDKPS